ncbi:GAGA binding-like protein [Artemisia annua]|uniref:GAGA-binding transcriptional activator n=1 Tax=Artemisia annua TaxID=35608 RepID=A0A2U1LDF2_ARTAN|nr:GAGA binding-like protein [Artemisia annua]
MSETNAGGLSFAQFTTPVTSSNPSQVTYTVAVPIRSVAPSTEPDNGPSKTTKNKHSKSKKSKKKTVLKPNTERKNPNLVFDESKFDFSKVPPPVCSCTGVARQCHKNGMMGWRSSCCSSGMSVFPLPMSPSRPGARVGGRKMRHSAYQKLLCKLASEGHDLSHPVDLKAHWAKLGTNNFVTIK